MAETSVIPNRFRAFNTMTYSVSLYLQSPERYGEMIATGKKDVSGLELLIQSGGASVDDSGGSLGAKRNKFFTRDFYLDDIQLSSYIAGTATGGPQNTFELNFTVTEPMGLTFMERLYNAATEYSEGLGYKNFNPVNQIYLVVIRFYGYDKNGKQVLNGKFDDGSDPEAYIEKWIPVMMKSVQFKVETAKAVYSCECVCPQTQIGHGQVNGTIPFNMALQGKFLEELLDGTAGTGTKRSYGGIETTGLMEALNNHQKTLSTASDKSAKKYEHANEYAIEFQDDSIAKATVGAPGTFAIQRSGTPGKATGQVISKMSTDSAKAINNVQTFATNAGMKIVKFLDLTLRSSSYITDQYAQITQQTKDSAGEFKKKNNKPLKWFKIRPRVEITNFDSLRQQWAYKITYVVTSYEVKTVDTRAFNGSDDCFEVHKEYDYWFTGKNTEVLDFKQEYNSFYYTTFSNKHKQDPDANPSQQTNLRAMQVSRANSGESQSSENMAGEQAANAASVLYAPQDIANVSIDILGDPDWLAQSELFYAATSEPGEAILDDGSINYDRAEVFFAVNFNTVVDYNLETGLADVTQKNLLQDFDGRNPGGVSQYSFVYRANTITTQLEKGKFTQQLNGTLVFIPETCIIKTTDPE